MYSPVFGVLIGVYITYKLMTDKDRIMAASDAYKTVYGSLLIKLSTIKIKIDIKKTEYGGKRISEN